MDTFLKELEMISSEWPGRLSWRW